MHGDTLTNAVIAVFTVLGVFAAVWVARRDGRRTRLADNEARVRELAREAITEALNPLRDRADAQRSDLNRLGDSVGRVEDGIKELLLTQRDTLDRTAKLEVKVSYFWETSAMNAAKTIHQPDPRRAELDGLIEAFTEGTLSDDERRDLKKYLVKMRDYEPSQGDIGFPVSPGEQSAASILLSTMDLVDPERMAAMGHVLHRSASDYKNGA